MVRRVPPTRWATVVAALLDGVSLVLTDVPRGVAFGDARRLTARAREREAGLVVHDREGRWPVPAALTLCATSSAWTQVEAEGYLTGRALQVRVEGRGAAARPISGELATAV